jgi:hypothetical protein
VDHARGFSGICTRPQWVTREASVDHAPGFSGVGRGGVLEPWASSDFLEKSWENLEPRLMPSWGINTWPFFCPSLFSPFLLNDFVAGCPLVRTSVEVCPTVHYR